MISNSSLYNFQKYFALVIGRACLAQLFKIKLEYKYFRNR